MAFKIEMNLKRENKIFGKYFEIKEIVIKIINLMKKNHKKGDFHSYNLIKSFEEIESFIEYVLEEKDFSIESRKILSKQYNEFFQNSHGGLSEFYFYSEEDIEGSRSDTRLFYIYINDVKIKISELLLL